MTVPINTYQDCDHFGYPAELDAEHELICTNCKQRIEMLNLADENDETICPACSGGGRRNGDWCPVCGGKGYLW